MTFSHLFFLLVIIVPSLADLNAQSHTEPCATVSHHLESMSSSPVYAEDYRERTEGRDAVLQSRRSASLPICEEVVYIPVAVHFQLPELTSLDCAIEMAESQIAVLNADFSAQNEEIAQWSEVQEIAFPAISNGSSCLRFCLATMDHPEGFGLLEGEPAVTLNVTEGNPLPEWSGYINFFVRDLGGGLLGYSPLGGMATGNGVTVHYEAFGTVECAGISLSTPNDLGRTATHEIGHYFSLTHPFDSGDCLTDGDMIDDTPYTDEASYGCPTETFVNCTENVLHMNFMEYVDDACMWIFTAGQVEMMEAHFVADLQAALAPAAIQCTPPVGLGENGNASQATFSIYPNPSRDEFTIQTEEQGQLTLTIMDSQGKVVIHRLLSTDRIVDVSALARGYYTARLRSGSDLMSVPLIKE